MKTLRDLNLEYWGRVHDMCKGTPLEGREWECVRSTNIYGTATFMHTGHPNFTDGYFNLTFALAILEGKPVFHLDNIWDKNGYEFDWDSPSYIERLTKYVWSYTWTPPTKKRKFMVELDDSDINGLITMVNYFNGCSGGQLIKKLTEARDKE